MPRISLKLFVEIRRPFALFRQQTELEPVVMFTAEVHQIGFFAASFAAALRRHRNDVIRILRWLVLELCRHKSLILSDGSLDFSTDDLSTDSSLVLNQSQDPFHRET